VRDAASFCAALCDREQQCDKALDHQTCKNACTNSYAAVFPKLREDVVELIVGCFDAKDCKTVLGGDVVGSCVSDAVAERRAERCRERLLRRRRCPRRRSAA